MKLEIGSWYRHTVTGSEFLYAGKARNDWGSVRASIVWRGSEYAAQRSFDEVYSWPLQKL